MAVAMPPIGFALGVAIAVRFSNLRSRHGVAIIAISIVAAVIWILLLTSGALNATGTSNDY